MDTAPASLVDTIRRACPTRRLTSSYDASVADSAALWASRHAAGPTAHRHGDRADPEEDRHQHPDRYPRPRRHPARLRLRHETRRVSALDVGDIITKPAGILINVCRSNIDQDARGQLVGVACGDNRLTNPIRALDDWLGVRPTGQGALFTRVIYPGRVTNERIGSGAVSRLVQERAIAAGFDGIPVTGHSLRAGHATTAAVNGAPIDRIAAQTRRRDLGTLLNHYIRPAEALATTTSRDLGL